MSSFGKTNVLFDFDHNSLLSFRKILFREGISMQEYFSHIIERVIDKEETLLFLLEEIKEKQLLKIKNGEETKKQIHSDTFYDLFEKALNKE